MTTLRFSLVAESPLRFGELIATLALARDNAFGQPLEPLPRSCPPTEQIADRLGISPKTADHHIQHIYTRIGDSTRPTAARWAMQNGIVP